MSIVKSVLVAAIGIIGMNASLAQAQDKASAEEAVAMVGKAVAHIKAVGSEKAFQDFTNKDPRFVDRDLYVTVNTHDGMTLAHGGNVKLVGRNVWDLRDADDKYIFQERAKLGAPGKPFWQEYKFSNPTTKKVESKSMYCEVLDNNHVCAGIYK